MPPHNLNDFMMSSNNCDQDIIPDAATSLSSNADVMMWPDNNTSSDSNMGMGGQISSQRSDRNNSRGSSSRDRDTSSLRRDREREGRCADCGAQTHHLFYEPETGSTRKIPLSVDNEVRRGRCLLCHPLPTSFHSLGSQPHQSSPQHHHHNQQQQYDRTAFCREAPHHLGNHSSRSLGAEGPTYETPPLREFVMNSTATGRQQHSSHQHSQSTNPTPQHHHQHQQQQYDRRAFWRAADPSHHLDNQSSRSLGAEGPTYESAAPPLREFVMNSTATPRQQHSSHHPHQHSQATIHTNHSNNNNPDAAAGQSQDQADICSILSTMRTHLTHIPTLTRSLHSIWVLSWEKENASAIGRADGIPLILNIMRSHPTATTLQLDGIAALQNLAINEYNRNDIVESDGVAVISDAMSRFLDEKAIQQSGCTALGNLANGSQFHKSNVAENGGVLAMLRAVDSHREDEGVLREAYQALRKLGFHPRSYGS